MAFVDDDAPPNYQGIKVCDLYQIMNYVVVVRASHAKAKEIYLWRTERVHKTDAPDFKSREMSREG